MTASQNTMTVEQIQNAIDENDRSYRRLEKERDQIGSRKYTYENIVEGWGRNDEGLTIDEAKGYLAVAKMELRDNLAQRKSLKEATKQLRIDLKAARANRKAETAETMIPVRLASRDQIASLRKLLDDACEPYMEPLRQYMIADYTDKAETFMAWVDAQEPNQHGKKKQSVWDYCEEQMVLKSGARSWQSSAGRHPDYVVLSTAIKMVGSYYDQTPEIDHERIAETVEAYVTEVKANYIDKNTVKLADVIASKELTEATKLAGQFYNGAIETEFRFTFADGASFNFVNKLVWVPAHWHRVAHVKYPATFHDVKLSDGSMMKLPSEKKMKTEFNGTAVAA